jgi:uncharacterized damage-inducible protein DinB
MDMLPEPWLRGPVAGVDPLVAPILFAFQQAREDLAAYTGGLTTDQIWATPFGLGSVGFHIRHIAGSTERLTAYLEQKQLSAGQFAALEQEKQPGASRERLLAEMDAAFRKTEVVVRGLDLTALAAPREAGRKRLPTTVIGLLTHIAEHTQRHVGQAICAARVVRIP